MCLTLYVVFILHSGSFLGIINMLSKCERLKGCLCFVSLILCIYLTNKCQFSCFCECNGWLFFSCDRLDLIVLAYLWERDQTTLLKEMIDCQVEAIVIKVATMGNVCCLRYI